MKFNTLVVCQGLLRTEGYHIQNRIESAYKVTDKWRMVWKEEKEIISET